jgi:hypothetical protein
VAVTFGRIVQCASNFRQPDYQPASFRYYLGGVLGSHAAFKAEIDHGSNNSIVLLNIPPKDVSRTTKKRDWIWFGRLLLLAAGITQSTATFVLSCRRVGKDRMSEIDIRNGFAAFGGLAVMLSSFLILLLNDQWTCQPSFQPQASANQLAGNLSGNTWPSRFHKASVTLSLLTSTWYLRFHIKDTYMVTRRLKQESFCTTYCGGSVTYVRPQEGGQIRLSNFVWLTWPFMLYNLQGWNEMAALLISAILSIGFPIEEIALGIFSTWKDPLAERWYLF